MEMDKGGQRGEIVSDSGGREWATGWYTFISNFGNEILQWNESAHVSHDQTTWTRE
jgi:hypothetical protein